MFPPKVPSSDVTWGSIGGPLRRGPLYHDGSLVSEENHLKGSYVSEWGWCTECMKSFNQCFDPGKVFFGRSVEIKTSGRCEQMEMRQILMWSPQCVRTKKHKKDKHGPKMGTSQNFGSSNHLESHGDIHEFYIQHPTFLGSNPLCLISPHVLPHFSSPNSRQFDEGNAQKRQDAEYETRLEKETHEILLSQLK